MNNNCPICGRPAYVGAWVVECETKGCQNYKNKLPGPIAAPAPKIGIGLTITWDRSCYEGADSVFVHSDDKRHGWNDVRYMLGISLGRNVTWTAIFEYFKKCNAKIIHIINSAGEFRDDPYTIDEFEQLLRDEGRL